MSPRVDAGPRTRGQRGVSLVEVMLVVVLTGMLLGPLFAWWFVATRQQPVITEDAVAVASTALLSRQLVRDIAVAGGAAESEARTATLDFGFEDCRSGGGSAGRVLLVLVRTGQDQATRTVYTETTSDGTASLWRRTCDADTGQGTSASRVIDDVQPGSTASCTDGPDGSVCRRVELRVTPVGAEPVVVRGVRRVDTASVRASLGGARAPIAKITVASQTSERPYRVEFSAETSSDPDGAIACYQWVFTTVAEGRGDPAPAYVTVEVPDPARDPAAGSPCPDRVAPVAETGGDTGPSGDLRRQLRTLPTSGVYYVELTVTDADGLSSTTYKRFEIEPRSPVAEARVSPVAGGTSTAGETLFEFAAAWTEDGEARGTRHPDGVIESYRWTLAGGGLAYEVVRSGAAPWYLALPTAMVGNVAVTLTVTDADGRSAQVATGVTLDPPADGSVLPGDTTWTLGAHGTVSGLRLGGEPGTAEGALVRWDPVALVDRYVVETDPGCLPAQLRVVGPTAELLAPVVPPGCEGASQIRVRVAVELAGELSPWSAWIDVATPARRIDPASLQSAPPVDEGGG